MAETINPGTYVHVIRLGDTASTDREATFLGNLTTQLEDVCTQLSTDPILSSAPAVNALGFSQGGLFLRAYVQKCNIPPVHNLVTFGSPHNGIAEFFDCNDDDSLLSGGPSEWICRTSLALLRFGRWSDFVQSRLVPAQYFRDPNDSHDLDVYRLKSNFLADINHERIHYDNHINDIENDDDDDENCNHKKHTTTTTTTSTTTPQHQHQHQNKTITPNTKNLSTLNRFVMYMFEDDNTILPKESSWFAEVNSTTGHITPLIDRPIYKQDWIGLKRLGEEGKLIFRSTPGEHMQLSDSLLGDTFREFFGPVDFTSTSRVDGGEIGVQQFGHGDNGDIVVQNGMI